MRFRPHVRHPWRLAGIIVGGIIAGLLIGLASVVPFRSETARRKIIEVLAERLDADVELTSLQIRLLPQFHAEAEGLAIRYKGRRDIPPMIAIKQISAEGRLLDVLR